MKTIKGSMANGKARYDGDIICCAFTKGKIVVLEKSIDWGPLAQGYIEGEFDCVELEKIVIVKGFIPAPTNKFNYELIGPNNDGTISAIETWSGPEFDPSRHQSPRVVKIKKQFGRGDTDSGTFIYKGSKEAMNIFMQREDVVKAFDAAFEAYEQRERQKVENGKKYKPWSAHQGGAEHIGEPIVSAPFDFDMNIHSSLSESRTIINTTPIRDVLDWGPGAQFRVNFSGWEDTSETTFLFCHVKGIKTLIKDRKEEVESIRYYDPNMVVYHGESNDGYRPSGETRGGYYRRDKFVTTTYHEVLEVEDNPFLKKGDVFITEFIDNWPLRRAEYHV